jgi:hypothetical protein
MPNTFKVKSDAAMPQTAGSPDDLYTVPGSTTSVILGLVLANVHTSQVNASVKLVSSTGNNQTTFLVKNAPIPVGSSLELLGGNKVVVETTDKIQIDCSVDGKIDATLSIMEIT